MKTCLRAVVVGVGLVVGAGLPACGGPASQEPEAAEQTGKTAQALVPTTSTPAPFPGDTFSPYTCQAGIDGELVIPRGETWYATPTGPYEYSDSYGRIDPDKTAYTHWYKWNLDLNSSGQCAQSTDQQCQHILSLYSISSADGYAYKVSQTLPPPPNDGTVQTPRYWYLMGLARYGTSYSMTPPASNGPNGSYTPTVPLSQEYPWYGPNPPANGADWGSLWQLVYNYKAVTNVQSSVHSCVTVMSYYYPSGSTVAVTTPIDYLVAADVFDPNGTNW